MITEESISKVLRDIQARVPKDLVKNHFISTPMTPTMKMVAEKALESDMAQEKKDEIKLLLENGYFDKEKITENRNIGKQIENFISREINKAVKEGRLPNKAQLRKLQTQWKEQKNNLSKS